MWALSAANTAAIAQNLTLEVQIITDDNPAIPAELAESELLARRVLSRKSSKSRFDDDNLSQLRRDIQDVLDTVRNFDQSLIAVTATPHFQPNVLLLSYEGDLKSAIADTFTGQSGMIQFNTGFQEFDELNRELGLFAVTYLSRLNVALFYFSKPVNIPVISARYAAIAGVRYAVADEYAQIFDTTDVDIYQTNDAWHLIFKNRNWDTVYSYLRVRDGKVDRYESESDCGDVPQFIPCPQLEQ